MNSVEEQDIFLEICQTGNLQILKQFLLTKPHFKVTQPQPLTGKTLRKWPLHLQALNMIRFSGII